MYYILHLSKTLCFKRKMLKVNLCKQFYFSRIRNIYHEKKCGKTFIIHNFFQLILIIIDPTHVVMVFFGKNRNLRRIINEMKKKNDFFFHSHQLPNIIFHSIHSQIICFQTIIANRLFASFPTPSTSGILQVKLDLVIIQAWFKVTHFSQLFSTFKITNTTQSN